jgi:hypothetical protein
MAGKDLFTDEEWALIASLPGLVIMGATVSDGKVMPSVREVAAGSEVLVAAAKTHPPDSIIGELVAGMKDSKPDLGEEKPTSGEAVLELLVGQIQTGWTTFTSKAPADDVAALRELLTGAAKAVVERLGTGFMGSGSEKVSPGEQAFVDRLAAVLGG